MITIIKLIKKMLRIQRGHEQNNQIDKRYLIPRTHHHLSKSDIGVNALKVLNRLNSAGFEAYLVGGSVRDLLLRKAPKDFDVATSATPNQVRQLFRNSRIIGRRFKLVHVIYNRDVIEVATFRRAHEASSNLQQVNEQGMLIRDNVFGSLKDDAWRRDITINSLYYGIHDGNIVDYTGGVTDIQHQLIRMIGDPEKRYLEDPVRMLRVIRFTAKLQTFSIEAQTKAPIKRLGHLLTHVSNSRLFDEMTKLYQCGQAKTAHQLMLEYDLFKFIFPATAYFLDNDLYPASLLIQTATENTDARIHDNKPVTPAFMFAVLLWFPMLHTMEQLKKEGLDPLPAIEKSMSMVLAEQSKITSIPKRLAVMIREIWILQFRFAKRTGTRAWLTLEHPRFRAAYDFMALRALAGHESIELAEWWRVFQEVDELEQTRMVKLFSKQSKEKSD